MVKLVTSIIAASALVVSASAIDDQVAQESASGVSLYEDEASLEASIAFMPEEEFASAAWEVEPAYEEEEEDSGLSLMAQLSNYIQNLIHPHSEEEEIEEEGIEEENIEEAQDINVNEASQPKNVKRMVGSARYRRQLNKRVDGHQDDQGFWHYSVPKHKPEHTPPPKQDEASSASPELEEFAIEQDLSEQAMQNSVEMEAFPFFPPPFDPIFWGALLPDKIKKRIASKVKEKVDEVAAHDPKLKEGLEKASEFIDKATKAIEDFKEKHHLGAGEPSAAPSPTS